MFHSFLVFWQGPNIYLSFRFLSLLFCCIIIIIIISLLEIFHTSTCWWSFSWVWATFSSSLHESSLADFNNAVVWMVFTCPRITKFSSDSTNPLGIVLSALITIGITVTFMFHTFLVLWQALGTYFSFLFLYFYPAIPDCKFYRYASFFFFLLSLGLVVWSRSGYPSVSHNYRELCASHSSGRILSCADTTC